MTRKSHWKCFIKKAVLKNFAIFIGKQDLFLIKSFQQRCFPVNIGKSFRTPILKNICERLLLNLVFNCNEEQHLLAKLDEMG